MNIKQIQQLIAESNSTGRPIQVRFHETDTWKPVGDSHIYHDAYYRVEPALEIKRPREWMLNTKGLIASPAGGSADRPWPDGAGVVPEDWVRVREIPKP